jgi:hypothetical protein
MANKSSGRTAIIPVPDRSQKFLEYYFQTFNIKEAAIKAGYSPKQPFTSAFLEKQLRVHQKRLQWMVDHGFKEEVKYDPLRQMNLTVEDLFSQLKYVIMQNNDLTNKLKAMAPFLKKEGVDIYNEDKQKSMPTVNIGIIENGLGTTGKTLVSGGGDDSKLAGEIAHT